MPLPSCCWPPQLLSHPLPLFFSVAVPWPSRWLNTSPIALCYIPSPRCGTASSRTPKRRYRQDLLANMAGLRRLLLDDRSRRSGRSSRRLCMVFIRPLLLPSPSCDSPGFLAETSPRPSQVCEPQLWCHNKVVGPGLQNNASMTRSA